MALGDRDLVQEGEGSLWEDAVPFISAKAILLHDRDDPLQPLAGSQSAAEAWIATPRR